MAIVTYGAGLGDFGDPSSFVDEQSAQLGTHSSTFAALIDSFGFAYELIGTGLSYDATGIIGGTATGLLVTGPGNAVLISITGFSLSAAPLALDLLHNRNVNRMVDGDDMVTGSANRDLMAGGKGDDTVNGGLGNDLIIVSAGRDHLKGGGGVDKFLFLPNGGSDVIVDFADTDGARDDLIAVSRGFYDQMTVIDGGGKVILDFGVGKIILPGMTVGQIGIDDFSFRDPFPGLV